MTFSRLRIIMKVEQKTSMSGNQPRPIIHEVIVVYILSFILDGPNWMMFEVKEKTTLLYSCLYGFWI